MVLKPRQSTRFGEIMNCISGFHVSLLGCAPVGENLIHEMALKSALITLPGLGLECSIKGCSEESALDFPKLTFYQPWAELQLQNLQSHSGTRATP